MYKVHAVFHKSRHVVIRKIKAIPIYSFYLTIKILKLIPQLLKINSLKLKKKLYPEDPYYRDGVNFCQNIHFSWEHLPDSVLVTYLQFHVIRAKY